MASWPVMQLPKTVTEVTEDIALRSQMESGIVVARPRFTRARRTYQLAWDNLRGTHYRILRAFYDAQHGGALSFSWTHPVEGVTYTVRFSSRLDAKSQVMDCWSVSVSIEVI